mgnify:CR=1 FL=1|jgi:hypothetical protein
MSKITKEAAYEISKILEWIDMYQGCQRHSMNTNGRDWGKKYYQFQLQEGMAVRMLFDDFGIEVPRLNFFTEEKMSEIEIKAKLEISKEAA